MLSIFVLLIGVNFSPLGIKIQKVNAVSTPILKSYSGLFCYGSGTCSVTLSNVSIGDIVLVGVQAGGESTNTNPAISDSFGQGGLYSLESLQTIDISGTYFKSAWFNITSGYSGNDIISIIGYVSQSLGLTAYDIIGGVMNSLNYSNNNLQTNFCNCSLASPFLQGAITLSTSAIWAITNCYPLCALLTWTPTINYTNNYDFASPPYIDAPTAYFSESCANVCSFMGLTSFLNNSFGAGTNQLLWLQSAISLGPYTIPIITTTTTLTLLGINSPNPINANWMIILMFNLILGFAFLIVAFAGSKSPFLFGLLFLGGMTVGGVIGNLSIGLNSGHLVDWIDPLIFGLLTAILLISRGV